MSCSDEVTNDNSENRAAEVFNLESDGINDNGVEEDGDNASSPDESSDEDFVISDTLNMPTFEERMAELNAEIQDGDDVGSDSSDSDDPENNWLEKATAFAN